MGHTNSTANLSLPQFIGTDKPTWLGDVNGAFLAIDGYAGTNDAAVAAAASDASSAISQASAAVNTANTANTTAGNASTAANNAVGVANNAVAIAGTVDSKVGLLANLNTTDRTSIVNAINEVLADTEGNAGSVSAYSDGVKTYAQVLESLHAQVDFSKISHKSFVVWNDGTNVYYAKVTKAGSAFLTFICEDTNGRSAFKVAASSELKTFTYATATAADGSLTVQPSGHTFTIFY